MTGPAPGGGERARRWRLVLGAAAGPPLGDPAAGRDAAVDAALAALYDRDDPDGGGPGGGPDGRDPGGGGGRRGGLGASAPATARWLGEIRRYFPATVVQVVQADAIERLDLTRLLLEPEMLAAVEPDVHLVGTLLSLGGVLPDAAREAARAVVRTVVADLQRRLTRPTRAAVTGALHRAARHRRPRPGDVDLDRTIRANLRHYQPAARTVVPERLVGHGRRAAAVPREVVLCVDQSASMAASVVHAGVLAAALAGVPSLRTSLVVFDTAVVDLTGRITDPVEVLLGTRLGGGTDVARALAYVQRLVTRPRDTVVVLVSDLFEGGPPERMLHRAAELTRSGAQVVVLLALGDDGVPDYDRENAAALAALGVPAFACTPDAFGDLLAAALQRRDLTGFGPR